MYSSVLCALLSCPFAARALELGPLQVDSTLGERLDARLDVMSSAGDDLSRVRVTLADVATYERFGVPRSDVLSSLEVSLVDRDGSDPFVRIRSTEAIHELFLSVLLEIDDDDVQLVREVAFLLDPSLLPLAATDAAPDGGVAAPDLSGKTYTVRTGDSLVRIAERLVSPGATPEQMAVALHEANPDAFLGSIHRLIVGARLLVPTDAAVRSRSPQAAKTVIRQGIERFRRRVAEAADDEGDAALRGARATALEPSGDIGGKAAADESVLILPVEDDVALQDFQAIIVNLKGSIHDIQGSLDERIERLDRLHSQVDRLIAERVRIRERATRNALEIAEARAAAAALLVPSADASENIAEAPPPEAEFPRATVSESIPGTPSAASPDDARAPEPSAGIEPPVETPWREVGPWANREPASEAVESDGWSFELPVDEPAAATPSTAGAPPSGVDEAVEATPGTADVPPLADAPGATGTVPADADATRTAPLAPPVPAATPAGTPLGEWSLERWMGLLRDAGLLALALCMIYVLLGRRLRRKGDEAPEDGTSEADPELEFYLPASAAGSTKEQLLQSALEDDPTRQDLRLRLIELHAENGSMGLFAEEAQTMYHMTKGNTPEWHRVVQLGLELDAHIDFYRTSMEDDPFDLALGLDDADRVSSVRGGTDVNGRRDRGPVDAVSFEGFKSLTDILAESDEADRFGAAETLPSLGGETGAHDLADGHVPAEEPPRDVAAAVPLAERPVYVPEDAAELIAVTVNYTYGIDKLDIDLGDASTETPVPASDIPSPGSMPTADSVGVDRPSLPETDASDPLGLVEFVDEDAAPAAGRSPELALEPDGTDASVDAEADAEAGAGATAGAEAGGTDEPAVVLHDDAIEELNAFATLDDLGAFGPDDTAGALAGVAEGEPGPVEIDDAAERPDAADELRLDVAFHTDDVDLQLNLAETYAEGGWDDEARELVAEVLPRADARQNRRAVELLERLAGSLTSDQAYG